MSQKEAQRYAVIQRVLQGQASQALAAQQLELSVRQIKKSVRYGGQMELRTAYRFEVEAYNHLVGTQDRMEGVRAFNEKRKPHFTGQ